MTGDDKSFAMSRIEVWNEFSARGFRVVREKMPGASASLPAAAPASVTNICGSSSSSLVEISDGPSVKSTAIKPEPDAGSTTLRPLRSIKSSKGEPICLDSENESPEETTLITPPSGKREADAHMITAAMELVFEQEGLILVIFLPWQTVSVYSLALNTGPAGKITSASTLSYFVVTY